jgi:hypothetical protein
MRRREFIAEKVFDVIEAEPDRLREVDGIGPVRAQRIVAAWAEQKVVREIMVFLHSHGVGTARAVPSSRPTAPTPSRSCRKIRTAWRGTSAASGSRPLMRSQAVVHGGHEWQRPKCTRTQCSNTQPINAAQPANITMSMFAHCDVPDISDAMRNRAPNRTDPN